MSHRLTRASRVVTALVLAAFVVPPAAAAAAHGAQVAEGDAAAGTESEPVLEWTSNFGGSISPVAADAVLGRVLVGAENSLVQLRLSDGAETGRAFIAQPSVAPPVIEHLDNGEPAVFVSGRDGTAFRIDPTTSPPRVVWALSLRRADCGTDGLRAAPVVQLRRLSTQAFRDRFPRDLVYFGTAYEGCTGSDRDNRVFALDVQSGQIVWTFNASRNFDVGRVNGMTIDPRTNRLYVATDRTGTSPSLHALDTLEGLPVWTRALTSSEEAPALLDGRLYLADRGGAVNAISAADGTDLWDGPLRSGLNVFRTAPAVVPDPDGPWIVATGTTGRVFGFRDLGNRGAAIWEAAGSRVTSKPAVHPHSDLVYAGTADGRVRQLELATGTETASVAIEEGGEAAVSSLVFVREPEGTGPFAMPGPLRLVAGTTAGTVAKVDPPQGVVPFAHAGPDLIGPEGSTLLLEGSGTTARRGAAPTFLWSTFTGAGADPGTSCVFGTPTEPSTTVTCNDDVRFAAVLTVSDGETTIRDFAEVTFTNEPPMIENLVVSGASPEGCDPVVASFEVSDPGSNDLGDITGVVDWGDGLQEPYAGTTVSTTHIYEPGSYILAITAEDGDGGLATAETTVDCEPRSDHPPQSSRPPWAPGPPPWAPGRPTGSQGVAE